MTTPGPTRAVEGRRPGTSTPSAAAVAGPIPTTGDAPYSSGEASERVRLTVGPGRSRALSMGDRPQKKQWSTPQKPQEAPRAGGAQVAGRRLLGHRAYTTRVSTPPAVYPRPPIEAIPFREVEA